MALNARLGSRALEGRAYCRRVGLPAVGQLQQVEGGQGGVGGSRGAGLTCRGACVLLRARMGASRRGGALSHPYSVQASH